MKGGGKDAAKGGCQARSGHRENVIKVIYVPLSLCPELYLNSYCRNTTAPVTALSVN